MGAADLQMPLWRRELGQTLRRLTGPNPANPYQRRDQRAQNRHLIATDAVAAGAINAYESHVIGTGLSMRALLDHRALSITQAASRRWQDNTNRRFEHWATSKNCDVGRRQDFYGLQQLAARSIWSSGDVMAHLPLMQERKNWPYRIAVQLIEADLVSNPDGKSDDPGKLLDGIVLEPETGAAAAAWIANRHPAVPSGIPRTWKRIPFEDERSGRINLLHPFRLFRPGQVRGIPLLQPVICKIQELSKYTEAEIAKAVTTAMLIMVTKMDPKAFEDMYLGDDESSVASKAGERFLNRAEEWDGSLDGNKAINLLPGEEATAFNSSASTSFDPFFRGVLQQVAIGIDLPVEVLMKHFMSSYTAARGALLEAARTWRIWADNMDKWFCTPIYQEWLADEVAMGRIEAPGFFTDPFRRWLWSACEWIGDGQGLLDPLKEAQASEKNIELGLATRRSESIKIDGKDWEGKHEQLVGEKRRRVKDGLELSVEQELGPAPVAGKSSASGSAPTQSDPGDSSDE